MEIFKGLPATGRRSSTAKMCTMKVNLPLFFKKQPHFVDFFTPGFFMNAPFLHKHKDRTYFIRLLLQNSIVTRMPQKSPCRIPAIFGGVAKKIFIPLLLVF